MKRLSFLVVVALGQAATPAQERALPTFEQFRVTEIYSGRPASPILKTPGERRFRTRIREGAAKGPNFAGHYTIASWGCGSAAISVVVIDATDGTVFNGPFSCLGFSYPRVLKYEGKYVPDEGHFRPLDFRLNSSLLIMRGCPDDENINCSDPRENGSYFYEWTGSRFKLLRKIPAVAVPASNERR